MTLQISSEAVIALGEHPLTYFFLKTGFLVVFPDV